MRKSLDITLKPKEARMLWQLFDDFKTGFIANPGARAERRRERYEADLRDILGRLQNFALMDYMPKRKDPALEPEPNQPEARHTPGPWNVMEGKTLWHVETDADNTEAGAGVPICSVPKKRKGDAYLIARAPDLLAENEALKAAIESIRIQLDGDLHGDNLLNYIDKLASDALAGKEDQ